MKEVLLGDGFHSRVIQVARGHFDKKRSLSPCRNSRLASRVDRLARAASSGEVSLKFLRPGGSLLDRFDSRVIAERSSAEYSCVLAG